MDQSLIAAIPVVREQRFRIPSPIEREIGLWVDRTGSARDHAGPRRPLLRILGQYAAVQIVAGHGRFISASAGELSVSAPDTILLFPEEPATYWPSGSWQTRWIVWNGEDARRLERAGYFSPRRPIVSDRLGAVGLAHAALQPILHREEREAVLRRKLIVLGMAHGLFSAAGRRAMDLRIAQAIAHISAHSAEPLSVSDLAAQARLSPAQFRRLFRRHTGAPPAPFIIAQRIARAKERLAAGDSMKRVAQATGFSDVFHFMRTFKRVVGVTAGRFAALERTAMGNTGP